MTQKLSYSDKLKDPRWQSRRSDILYLFDNTCVGCGSKSNINVHHRRYLKGLEPWEYQDCDLITLCVDCHKIYHKNSEKIIDLLSKQCRLYYEYEAGLVFKILESLLEVDTNSYSEISSFINERKVNF